MFPKDMPRKKKPFFNARLTHHCVAEMCAGENQAGTGAEDHLSLQKKIPIEVIQEFVPIIRRIAGALASRLSPSLDVEDLTSAGIIGLMSAMGRYDPHRETKFRTYAEYRIRGMMLDEMRSLDWVPRSVRFKHEQMRQVCADIFKREGRQPNREEVARHLGITEDELEAIASRNNHLFSLDESVGLMEEDGVTFKDILPDTEGPDPLALCLSSETSQALETAIERLVPKQRKVVRLYYFQGITMKEIGKRLGLTESGVCRIHGQALKKLRKTLQGIQGDETEAFPCAVEGSPRESRASLLHADSTVEKIS